MAGTRGNFHDTDNKRPWQRFTLAFGTTAIETDMLRSNLLISLLLLVLLPHTMVRQWKAGSQPGGAELASIFPPWEVSVTKYTTEETANEQLLKFRTWKQECFDVVRCDFGRKCQNIAHNFIAGVLAGNFTRTEKESTRVQSALAVKSAR